VGFAAVQTLVGATKLSELGIDVSKNWLTYLLKNIGAPTEDQDAATKKYVDDNIGGITKLSELTIDTSKDWLTELIKNLGDPVDDQDAVTKAYADTIDGRLDDASYTYNTKATNTIYQNESDKLQLVIGYFEANLLSYDGTLEGTSSIRLKLGSTSPPSINTMAGGFHNVILNGLTSGLNRLQAYFFVMAVVPPGWYYEFHKAVSLDGYDITVVGRIIYTLF